MLQFYERIQRGGGGGGGGGQGGGGAGGQDPPLINHKNIGFPSNIGPAPQSYIPSQHSMLGQNRHTSETPFK